MVVSNPRAHPRCRNAGNPYHECTEFCFKKIAEGPSDGDQHQVTAEAPQAAQLPATFGRQGGVKRRKGGEGETAVDAGGDEGKVKAVVPEQAQEPEKEEEEEQAPDPQYMEGMSERQKKMFELRMKLNQARKANQTAVIAEKKRADAPKETHGISRQKWLEEQKKKMGKQLESNGLDIKQAYMLDTQEQAEAKYKKRNKKEAAFGWDIFNQKSLYNSYKNRTKSLTTNMEEYNKAKEADPEFYRDSSSLQYGKQVDLPEENINRMVGELEDRQNKRRDFSRRRTFHDEKDIDSINDRNEHFNRKIERAFGKYTVEIKNNLERGTALPD
eukprot:jgi/Mesen1/5795/ME000293S04953